MLFSILAHRLRRWPNIETTLSQVLVFAGITYFLNHPLVWEGLARAVILMTRAKKEKGHPVVVFRPY